MNEKKDEITSVFEWCMEELDQVYMRLEDVRTTLQACLDEWEAEDAREELDEG